MVINVGVSKYSFSLLVLPSNARMNNKIEYDGGRQAERAPLAAENAKPYHRDAFPSTFRRRVQLTASRLKRGEPLSCVVCDGHI